VSFDLHVDRLDLDRYLQPAGQNPPPAGPTAAPEPGRDAHPASPGRRLPPVPALNGTIAIDRLTCMHVRLEHVSLRLAGSEGGLAIDPVAAMLYEGSTAGRVEVDLRSDPPRTSIQATLEGVQVGPLLKDLSGNEVLDGRARAGLSLSMAGDRPSGMLRTLAGNGRVNVTDGAVVGLDLLGGARGSKANGEGARPHTDFSELTVPFTIEGGIVHIADAAAVSPPLHFTAAGRVDLVQETLNLRIEPRMSAEGGIGIVIAGRFSNPEIHPDLEGVARKALKKALGDDADDVSRKAGDLLKGLLPKKKP
jgi:AsmA protein